MRRKDIELVTLTVGQMKANCYLLIENKYRKCLIVDAGDDADYIETIIRNKDLFPQAILATHGHFDHLMAALQLQLNFNIPFMIHENDVFLVKNMRESARHFLKLEAGPSPVINSYLYKESVINLGGLSLKVIETPGHTPGSVCLYSQKEGFILCGDLIFAGGSVGRTDFSYSNKLKLEKSVEQIFHYPLDTVLYPGHGPKTRIKDERKFYTL